MKRVLIVDDDERVRKVLRKFLEKLPLEIQEAKDGEKGSTLFLQKTFDLVIVDYRMPNVDGLAMLKQCRELFPEHPCIVISGERPEGIDPLNKVYFFQKPINASLLINLITNLLHLNW